MFLNHLLYNNEKVIHDDRQEAIVVEFLLEFSHLLVVLIEYTEENNLKIFDKIFLKFTFRKNLQDQKCPSRLDLTFPRRISRLINTAITKRS